MKITFLTPTHDALMVSSRMVNERYERKFRAQEGNISLFYRSLTRRSTFSVYWVYELKDLLKKYFEFILS